MAGVNLYMTIQEVLDILNKRVKIPVDMSDMLCKWRGVYHGISLHTLGAQPCYTDLRTGKKVKPIGYINQEYQDIFETSLFSRHPREDDDTRSWRFANYRPLTKAAFGQITEIVSGAIFQDSNYHVEIPEIRDNEYIWNNNFYGYDLAGYFANIGFKNMVEDPNGVFLRIPSKPYSEQSASKLEVDIWFVNTTDMVWFDKQNIIFKRGEYAYWIDTETIFRIKYEKSKQYTEVEPYYAHMLGKLPVTIAGGEWNTQGYFDSFYDKAKPIADDFISTYSAAQMVDKEASHPFIETVPEGCGECQGNGQVKVSCGCDGGCTKCGGTGIVLGMCGNCGGNGYISVYPGRWRQVPEALIKDGTIKITNPDISINKHHRETVKELTERLLTSLHIYNTDKSESGEAKSIDQERLYKFTSTISNHLFDKIIYDTIADIIAYRNVRSTGETIQPYTYDFKIVKPTQFKIKTSDELLEEYQTATTANAPILIRHRIAMDYVLKAYNGDAVMAKKMELINQIDTLGMYPTANWLSMRAAGAISDRDMIINRMLPTWLEDLYLKKGDAFLKMTKEQVIAYIEPLIKEQTPPAIDLDTDN